MGEVPFHSHGAAIGAVDKVAGKVGRSGRRNVCSQPAFHAVVLVNAVGLGIISYYLI